MKNFKQFITESNKFITSKDKLFSFTCKPSHFKFDENTFEFASDFIDYKLDKTEMDYTLDGGFGSYTFTSTKENLKEIIKILELEKYNLKLREVENTI